MNNDTKMASDQSAIYHLSISALSDLNYHFKEENEEDTYSHSGNDVKKHVRMLDAISLLFVFESSGEVCATSFTQNPHQAVIYWAKNDPSKPTPQQQKYLENLLSAFESQSPKIQILEMCVRQCFSKVLARCRKASKVFSFSTIKPNILRINEDDLHMIALQNTLRKENMIQSYITLAMALDVFIENLSKLNKNSTVADLCQIVKFADLVTPQEAVNEDGAFSSPIFNPIQLRYVKKIAAYRRIIRYVHTMCKKRGIKSLKERQVCFLVFFTLLKL